MPNQEITLEYLTTILADGKPIWRAAFSADKAEAAANGGNFIAADGPTPEAAIGLLVLYKPELFTINTQFGN